MLFYVIALLITAVDQLAKFLVHRFMYVGQSIPLLKGILRLTYVRNTGAAFSLFVGFSPYLVGISVGVILIIIYFHYRVPRDDYFTQIALALILGGSLGNLTDRFVRGYVIDFIDFQIWPVFNLADVMINIGAILSVIRLLTKK